MLPYCRFAIWGLFFALSISGARAESSEATDDSEGTVKFFVDAHSNFDRWTRNPSEDQQAWMRENYFRMQTYSRYFDRRLAWYENAWVYKNSYAIKPSWPVFAKHPEWVLRDANGTMLYIPWGCSGGRCPQFAGDIGNPDFRNWWIAGARSRIDLGYRGVWIDDVNFLWRVSNGHGEITRPIDPRTQQEMTLQDWRRYFVDFLEEIRHALPEAELTVNFVWFAEKKHDPFIARAFDAADYVALQRGISDKGIVGGNGKFGFETFLALVDRVHARGKNVVMKDDDDVSIAARNYELAFYFLINNGGDLIGADGDRHRMNPENFWSGYRINLGAATGGRYRWQGLFRRDFECGMVLVNQPGGSTAHVELGEVLMNVDGQSVSAVTMGPASGEVLIRPCEP